MQPQSLKHPGRWIWLLLLVPAALGLARLRLDVEVFDLLPADLKVVQGLKLYQEHFTNARQLLLTLKGSEPEQTESAARRIAESLREHTNLVTAVNWEPPWLEHPDQVAELLAYLWFNQPPAAFGQLTHRLAPDQLARTLTNTREQLATSLSPEAIARLSYDPFGLTRLPESVGGAAPSFARGQELFSSPDGKFRIVFVQARPELRSYRDCQRWLEAIKPLVQAAVATPRSAAVLAAAAPETPGGAEPVKLTPVIGTAAAESAALRFNEQAAAAGGESGTNSVVVGYTGRPALVAETAAGMEHDIVVSVGGTAAIIALLFWLAHRRVKPMLWLLTLLALILACTLALGGLIYGTINVVSIGFAAILLGLAVDYAVVHYQEALAHPHLSIPQIRHAIAPSIFWAAVTTITAFLVLNLGGLPGLGQLGTLVALGVALAASIMIFEFLPPLFPGRNEPGPAPVGTAAPETSLTVRGTRPHVGTVFGITGAVLVFTLVVLVLLGQPKIDPTANALRPLGLPAYAALEEVQANLNQKREPLWLIVSGQTLPEVAQRLDRGQAALGRALTNHLLASYTLPAALWPRPEFQQQNRPVAHYLVVERPRLRQAAETNGFAPSSLALTERMLDTWERASSSEGVFWPTNDLSRWILEKVTARSPTNSFALGFVTPASSNPAAVHAAVAQLEPDLPEQGVWLSGWELLGNAIFSRVRANLWKVVAPMVVLVFLSLWFAFRRSVEILLSLFALALSGLCLLTVMRLVGWSWNLLNMMALPLVLGTGVDYSIFMQLALRRFHGDLSLAYHSVGRALLLCGGTAIAAFASLTWSSNAGMASLGAVCAVGIAFNVVIAIFLAPVWWHVFAGHVYRQG